jgi:hypothetical protein
MKFVLVLFSLLLLGSCVTQQNCNKKFPPASNIKDSVVVRDSFVIKTIVKETIKDSIRIKDSTVVVQGVSGEDSIPCNENSTTIIRRGEDVFRIQIKEGKVFLSYDLKGTQSRYQSIIQNKDKEYKEAIESFKATSVNASHSEVKVVVSEISYIPWWVKILAWIGAIGIFWLAFKKLINSI